VLVSVDLSKTELSPDLASAPASTVLHGLLQRLELQQPGLIASLTEGALHDSAAIDPEESVSAAHGCQIAEEALRMLRLMSEQLNSSAKR
jgi:hypothetical protein